MFRYASDATKIDFSLAKYTPVVSSNLRIYIFFKRVYVRKKITYIITSLEYNK